MPLRSTSFSILTCSTLLFALLTVCNSCLWVANRHIPPPWPCAYFRWRRNVNDGAHATAVSRITVSTTPVLMRKPLLSVRVIYIVHALYQVYYYPPCCTDSVRRRARGMADTYRRTWPPQAAQQPRGEAGAGMLFRDTAHPSQSCIHRRIIPCNISVNGSLDL